MLWQSIFVVGGYFNSPLDDGPLGFQLQELTDGFNLQFWNHHHRLAMYDVWTYEHTLHRRHHIGFILASYHWTAVDGKADNELDLGSDHRAVRTSMHLRAKVIRRHYHAKKITRG